MKINPKAEDILEALGLKFEDAVDVASKLQKLLSNREVIKYPEALHEMWESFKDESDEKKLFAVFSLGRFLGILEACSGQEEAKTIIYFLQTGRRGEYIQ